jgi:hypothetical protein
MNNLRLLLLNIISVFIFVCSIFILFELSLRMLVPINYSVNKLTTNPYFRISENEPVDWDLVTSNFLLATPPGMMVNGFAANSSGFISPEYTFIKPPGIKRIVFIGDSQTVGVVPYPNHFTRIIESKLNKEYSFSTQVVNLGLFGIGPAVETQILRQIGVKYQPDLTVLVFFTGNDYFDDEQNKNILTPKSLPLLPEQFYKSKLISLLRNIYFYYLSGVLYPKVEMKKKVDYGKYFGDPRYDSQKATFPENMFLEMESNRSLISLATSSAYKNLDGIKNEILMMQKTAASVNSKFLVIILPDELQINRELLNQIAQYKKMAMENFDLRLPQQKLIPFLKARQIPFVDIFEMWSVSPVYQRFYQLRDTHLNIEGNISVADIIYPYIQKELESKLH